ncbi:hypothetical protein QC762_0041850 [Podospora pseudocomata]|uniref:Uncharacterized protein n=1 Tax=Podospora pseudocomata TaxID=2093779 RepID=A0ABR0GMS5_9PEZI|nr:hypothetical protein QC762_0041850 [Podospora pseudocomata]
MSSTLKLALLNPLQHPLKLTPIPHHHHRPRLSQHLCHVLLLLLRIRPNIPHHLNSRPRPAQRPRLAVLNSNTLLRPLPHDLDRMQINRRIRLARRHRQARRRTINILPKLGDDDVFLAADVVVEFGVGHGEVVALLEGDHHAAEVLADEFCDEGGAGEGLGEGDGFGGGDFVD